MTEKMSTSNKIADVTQTVMPRSIIPFTGGLIIFLWAFFGPESYGRWLGTIVHAFRAAAGI